MSQGPIHISLQQLRGMIGQHVQYQGDAYTVIEVLEQDTELVLQIQDEVHEIQPDQHGDAHRRVPATVTLPVLTADRSQLHPSFLSLNLL